MELTLFAPYNERVDVLGTFTNWDPLPMKKSTDGWWRASIDLPDGDHEYRFRVQSLSETLRGKLVEIFDPYAPEVTNDGRDNSVLRMRGGRRVWTQYKWRHDDVPLPDNRDLIIYEMLVADFAGTTDRAGRFDDVVHRLDDLKDLGINCIELMPVKFFSGKGWGYNLKSLFAVANVYGTPDDLCRLIDECHKRGMRVLVDGVYNHADAGSPLAQIDHDYWYYQQNPDPPQMRWGPKFNFQHFDEHLNVFPARKYVLESIHFWVEKFHIDGIRFDATRAIGNFDAMKEMSDAGFKQIDGRKPFLTVAEHVPEDPSISGYPNGPMVAAWRFSLAAKFRAVLTAREDDGQSPDDFEGFLKALDLSANGYVNGNRCVNYIVSHDHDRLMQVLGSKGGIFDDAAFARVRLGMGLLAMMPGIPMIWMGQEFGAAAEKCLEPRPLDWSLLRNERNRNLRNHVRMLFRLRQGMPALRGDAFEICMKDGARRIFAFKRWNSEGNVIVVVANMKHEMSGEFVVENCGLEDGVWHEATNNFDYTVVDGRIKETLGPSEVKIFVKNSKTEPGTRIDGRSSHRTRDTIADEIGGPFVITSAAEEADNVGEILKSNS